MDEMKKSGYVVDVNTDIQQNMPEVQLIPDRAALARMAVSLSTVTKALNALVGGHYLYKENEYPKDRHRYEMEMRLIASQRESIPDLNRIKVRNNRGETVPLSELVDETSQAKLDADFALKSRPRHHRLRESCTGPLPARGPR